MVYFIPKTESITGASLSGSNGAANRTYALANSGADDDNFAIIIENTSLQPNVDFTLATDTITFINKIWDDQNITLNYFTTSVVASSPLYTTTKKVIKYFSGLGVSIENENLGTGDNAEQSYDAANGNIIASTYTLKYGPPAADNDTNDLTELTEGTHYTLEKAGGTILLTSAGVTLINGSVLYISYTHSPKMSNEVVNNYIQSASNEVDKITGNYWGPVKTTIETSDGREDNPYPETDEPYATNHDEPDFIQLKYKGVESITSIVFTTGTATRTLVSANYRFDSNGFITLLNDRLPVGYLNVTTTYTHGYDSVDPLICELASLLVGIRAYVNISGGSYDDATSFTLDKKAVTIGEAWVNIREVISQAKKRVVEIKNSLGPKMNVV